VGKVKLGKVIISDDPSVGECIYATLPSRDVKGKISVVNANGKDTFPVDFEVVRPPWESDCKLSVTLDKAEWFGNHDGLNVTWSYHNVGKVDCWLCNSSLGVSGSMNNLLPIRSNKGGCYVETTVFESYANKDACADRITLKPGEKVTRTFDPFVLDALKFDPKKGLTSGGKSFQIRKECFTEPYPQKMFMQFLGTNAHEVFVEKSNILEFPWKTEE